MQPARPLSLARFKTKAILLAVLLCLVFSGVAWWLSLGQDVENRDFFMYWLGGRMVLNGQDVYSSVDWLGQDAAFGVKWIQYDVFVYPMPLAVLMTPLGSLDLKTAYAIWVFAGMVGITVSFLLLLEMWNNPANRVYILPLFIGLPLYRPLIVILRNGQLGAILLTALTLTVYLWEKGKWYLGGVLVGLVALKPQFGAPLLGLLGIWLLTRRQWRAIAGMATCGLFLAAIGWLQRPDWISAFFSATSRLMGFYLGLAPTLWGLSRLACSGEMSCLTWLGLALAAVLGTGAAALLVWRGRQIRPALAMSLVICCSLLVTPYLWAYDHILLLIPLLLAAGQMAALRMPFLATGTLLLGASLVSLVLLSVAMVRGTDEFSALFPLLCLAGIGVLFRRELWKTASVKTS